jgi:anti-anti-sigma factor
VTGEPGVTRPGDRVIELTGEWDIATLSELRNRVRGAAGVDQQRIVIDLAAVEFIDARSLAAVVVEAQVQRAAGREVVIRRPRRTVRRVLQLLGAARFVEDAAVDVPRQRRPDVCPACLGSHECWVCLGAGWLESRGRDRPTCGHCGGTGTCSVCRRRDDFRY